MRIGQASLLIIFTNMQRGLFLFRYARSTNRLFMYGVYDKNSWPNICVSESGIFTIVLFHDTLKQRPDGLLEYAMMGGPSGHESLVITSDRTLNQDHCSRWHSPNSRVAETLK
jgi:hypothetical protein